MNDTAENWIDDMLSLATNARTNAGVSDDEARAAIESMSILRNDYKVKAGVPMAVVNVRIDLQSSLISSGTRHREELGNEQMAARLYELASRLTDIARDMTL
ncbi:hypothetical protein EGY31_29040 [Burkholderia multivorans]|uniref:hypothetical protein n=1 Tax=Burkholderia ubonensis TaxID=101571 RepID=UPI000F703FF0|nr:hypothetical protein [Burkholderia ubonensis]AYZ67152.1 hypothetical protein EGY31_29040 [Burkholderia multivorans]VWB15484.1 hypothetical protein BUB20358_00559 [Burkholderia ubonensis]